MKKINGPVDLSAIRAFPVTVFADVLYCVSRRNYSESPTTSPTSGDDSDVDEQYLKP